MNLQKKINMIYIHEKMVKIFFSYSSATQMLPVSNSLQKIGRWNSKYLNSE